jgi:hypothetical protein
LENAFCKGFSPGLENAETEVDDFKYLTGMLFAGAFSKTPGSPLKSPTRKKGNRGVAVWDRPPVGGVEKGKQS